MTQEELYDFSFRGEDTALLSEHLAHFHSVSLIGMKRVGINNFLKFYLNHPEILQSHLTDKIHPLFFHIDLNDLVERDIYPFWTLTLKRLVDNLENATGCEKILPVTRKLFTESIQLKDLFITVDSVRKILALLVKENKYPILIFNRFDRMKDAINPEFFSNLQSLNDHAERNLAYIFTSFRPLHELSPAVFKKAELTVFCHDMYLKPAKTEDASIILKALEQNYKIAIPTKARDHILSLTAGHVQFLHLSMIKLRDAKTIPNDANELSKLLLNNEEATLLSEELYESLTSNEQASLHKPTKKTIDDYLLNTGLVASKQDKLQVFSPLFAKFLEKKGPKTKSQIMPTEFTKKEFLLFSYLQNNENSLCEREDIIEAVWPDYTEAGVSDWAIDRLVARVRTKLKLQKSEYEIITVITRGYKLQKLNQ